MRITRPFTITLLSLLLLALAGCSNPAENKIEAKVEEAKAETGKASGGEVLPIDAEMSKVSWVGSKVTGKHEGGFNSFTGEIQLVGDTPEGSSVGVRIDTTSLWSDNERLTGHLKSPDFFDVETFPTATFKSTEIKKTADGYEITGNLDLHGVTKSITFPAQIEVGDTEVTANAEFFIKRFDFGIEYKGKADDLIRDEVVITLDLKAPRGSAG